VTADADCRHVSGNEKRLFNKPVNRRQNALTSSPGGNAYGSANALCLRDYGWYLRLITYGVLAGDKEPIEKIGLIGVREMYNLWEYPFQGWWNRSLPQESRTRLTQSRRRSRSSALL